MVTYSCIGCGKALIVGARFCGDCGLETGNHTSSIAKSSTPVAKIEVCPKCGQVDTVAKVSGIVSQKVHQPRGHGDSGYVVTSIDSVPQLKLAEPYEYRPFITLIKVLAVPLFLSIPLDLAVVIPALAGDFTFFMEVFPIVWKIAVIVAIIAMLHHFVRGSRLRSRAVVEAQCWPRRKSGWDKLYYCYRDDLVFVDGRHAPASRMLDFLDGM